MSEVMGYHRVFVKHTMEIWWVESCKRLRLNGQDWPRYLSDFCSAALQSLAATIPSSSLSLTGQSWPSMYVCLPVRVCSEADTDHLSYLQLLSAYSAIRHSIPQGSTEWCWWCWWHWLTCHRTCTIKVMRTVQGPNIAWLGSRGSRFCRSDSPGCSKYIWSI